MGFGWVFIFLDAAEGGFFFLFWGFFVLLGVFLVLFFGFLAPPKKNNCWGVCEQGTDRSDVLECLCWLKTNRDYIMCRDMEILVSLEDVLSWLKVRQSSCCCALLPARPYTPALGTQELLCGNTNHTTFPLMLSPGLTWIRKHLRKSGPI